MAESKSDTAKNTTSHPDDMTDRDYQALKARVEQLETELSRSARGALPLTDVPEHSAGVGVDSFAQSWSLYDQELARRGEHPHQNGEHADWLAHPDKVQQHRTYGAVRDDDPRLTRS